MNKVQLYGYNDNFELLTGKGNIIAQSVYSKLGYTDDNELHLSKRIKKQIPIGQFYNRDKS